MSEGESARKRDLDHGDLDGAKDSKEPISSDSETQEPEVKRHRVYKVNRNQSHKWDGTSQFWTIRSGNWDRWWIENPPVLSEADPGYLCKLCRHINFKQLIDEPNEDECIFIGTPRYHSEQTSCSFCNLITHGYRLLHPEYQDFAGALSLYTGLGPGLYNFPNPLGILGLWAHEPCEILHHRPAIYRIGTRPGDGRRIPAKFAGTDSGRNWLAACETGHDAEPLETVVHDLLLIDVVDGRVKRVSGNCKYAALSYVRGEGKQVQYEASTKEILEKPNGLFSNALQMPQTIKDAAEFAKHIGLQYLWVDSLCICQDDAAEKEATHGKMGSIYRNAVITIVDAYGSSAKDGLLGISISRSDTYIRQVQGMELASARDLSFANSLESVDFSPWSSRGWTFQEMVMSSRLLIVTEKQLQFICGHAMYFEELNAHLPQEKTWKLHPSTKSIIRLSHEGRLPWSDYRSLVHAYSRRTLTHETDILSAFSGVLEMLSRGTPSTHFFNLPAAILDEALLWTTDSPFSHERYYRELSRSAFEKERDNTIEYWKREHRRNVPGFPTPSWSWAGWDHAVQYPWLIDRIVPSIRWKCRTALTNEPEHLFSSQEFRCANWRELGWKCLKRGSKYAPTFEYVHPSKPDLHFPHPMALSPDMGNAMSPMQGSTVLTFQGFCLPIATKNNQEDGDPAGMWLAPEWHSSWRWLQATLYDDAKHKAGSMRLDVSLENRPPTERNTGLIALSRFSSCPDQYPIGDPLDVDETLLNNISLPRQDCGPTHKWDIYWKRFDRRKFEEKLLDCYNVLLVEWEHGIAYRMGLGHIHIDAFHAANPIWQDVRLG